MTKQYFVSLVLILFGIACSSNRPDPAYQRNGITLPMAQVRNAWLDLGHLYLELATDPERQRVFAQQSQQANNGQGAPLLPEQNLDYRFARLWLTKSAQQFSHRITAKPEDHTSTGIAAQYGLPSMWIETRVPK